jgi:hypothetical protein
LTSGWRGSAKRSSRAANAANADLVARALSWALSRRGSPAYALRCLAFVEDAFERANQIEVFGGSSAAEAADLYGVLAYDPARPPPAGALVFYACSGPIDGVSAEWGHVGLSLGVGRVVHGWDVVRVDDATAVTRLAPAAGWSAPRLLGWTRVERVLDGHRPRRWDGGSA